MKKLRWIVAALLIASIGGVYATWTYLSNTNISLTHSVASFGMADVVEDNTLQVGSYGVTDNIGGFTIDQKAENDYTAVLKVNYTTGTAPDITVSFTPKTGASTTIQTKGITTYVYFGFANAPKYGDPAVEVFSCTYNAGNYFTIGEVGSSETLQWSDADSDGTFEAKLTITETQLIQLTQNFVLDTVEENEAFEACLSELNIYVTSQVPTVS